MKKDPTVPSEQYGKESDYSTFKETNKEISILNLLEQVLPLPTPTETLIQPQEQSFLPEICPHAERSCGNDVGTL